MPKKLRVDVTDLKRGKQQLPKPIFCGKDGLWKAELEQRLQESDEIVLLSKPVDIL